MARQRRPGIRFSPGAPGSDEWVKRRLVSLQVSRMLA